MSCRELLHRALRRRSGRPSTSRTTSTPSTWTCPDPAAWEPFGVGNARGTTAYVLRNRHARSLIDAGGPPRPGAAGEIEEVGLTTRRGRLARRAAGRRMAGRSAPWCPDLHRSRSGYADGDRRPPGLRRPAHRRRADARPRARGDAPAQRRARPGQRDRPGARASSSSSRPSSSSSATGSSAIFDAQSLFIALHDPETRQLTFPYDIDEGERFDRGDPAARSGPHVAGHQDRPVDPHRHARRSRMAAGAVSVGGSDTQSWLGAPIPAGNARHRRRRPREHPTRMPSARTTSGSSRRSPSSMGVALENARLFDETKRLLTRDRTSGPPSWRSSTRSARPSPSSSTSRRSSSSSASGSRRSFEAPRRSTSRSSTQAAGMSRSRTGSTRASRYQRRRRFRSAQGLTRRSSELAARRCASGRTTRSRPHGAIRSGRRPESWLGVPIPAGDRVIGVIALETSTSDAFNEARRPPADDPRREHGRRARERPAVRRDEAPARRDQRARRRARDHQRRPAGPRRSSSTCRRCTTWSATRSRRSSTRRWSTSAFSTARPAPHPLPVHHRARDPLSRTSRSRSSGFRRARHRVRPAAA